MNPCSNPDALCTARCIDRCDWLQTVYAEIMAETLGTAEDVEWQIADMEQGR